MGFRTWLESLEVTFDKEIVESLLREAPHVFGFTGEFPGPLAILQGRNADMGFEDMGDEEFRARLERAFSGTGVVIPGTGLKMRYVYPTVEIAPTDDSETESLPANWRSYLTVFSLSDGGVAFKWVGKNVRQDRFHGLDISNFKDAGDGWLMS